MSLWTITLILGYAVVIILNLVFSFSLTTALNLFIVVVIIMLPALLYLFIGRTLPKKWFNENKWFFKINHFKQKVCEITNVKVWKDKIPVGGRTAGFRLNKLVSPKDIVYLDRFIYESCFAEWLHVNLCFWSIIASVIILIINSSLFLPMALPIALLFIYQNLTSSIIQWYVRPRIIQLRQIVLKRSQKEN